VALSRENICAIIYKFLDSKRISKSEFRKIFYSSNSAYYKQGALTYGSNISIVGAENYSILGKKLYGSDNGILLAYDPLLLLMIFKFFDISEHAINLLTIEDLCKIRNTKEFHSFKKSYRDFSVALQQIELKTSRLSVNQLDRVKDELLTNFIQTYLEEQGIYSNQKNKWNLSESLLFSYISGAIGFVVLPIWGAVTGFVPIVLQKSGITPKLSDFIIDRITEKETSFYQFIKAIKSFSNHLETKGK
jgi:hypothetical protein